MKPIPLILFIVVVNFFGTGYTKFCDPVRTPFNEILNRFDPQFNTAVEGYFISENIFKVTYSYSPSIEAGSEQQVFEYGPFGNRCESFEMANSVNKDLIGAKNSRLLLLYKDRSRNGKLVTPIFHGIGAAIANRKTVMFYNYVYNDKTGNSQYYTFSTALASVRNLLHQKVPATSVKWNSKLLK